MTPVRDRLFKCLLVLFFIPLFLGANEPNGTDLSKHFKVTWALSELNKSLTFNESSPSGMKHSERLSVNLDVEILKPDLVFAITRECVITEVLDRNGKQITKPYGLKINNSKRMSYNNLSYRKRSVRTPQPNKWLTRIRSVLKLPRRSKRHWSSKQIEELKSQRLSVTLDSDLCRKSGGEFATIKGYFYILRAESYEYVDGPFEPHKNPVLLTNNDEINIVRSSAEDQAYFLLLEHRPSHRSGIERYLSTGYMRPIEIDVQRLLGEISVGDFL